MKIKNRIERWGVFWSILVLTFWLGGGYFFLCPNWAASTDQALQLALQKSELTRGAMHISLQKLLILAYQYNSSIQWFPLYLYVLGGFSLLTLSTLLLWHKGSRWRLLIWVILLPVLIWSIAQHFSSLSIAIVILGTANLLLIQGMNPQKHWRSWAIFLLTFLLTIAGLLLDSWASIVGIISVVLWIHGMIKNSKNWLRHLLQLLLLIGLGLGIYITDLEAKKDLETMPSIAQKVLNAMQLYDWENYRWTKENASLYQEQLGWRAADYFLIQAGYRADTLLLGNESLQLLDQKLGALPYLSREGALQKLNHFAFKELRSASAWILILLLVLIMSISSFKTSKGLAWAILGTTFLWIILLALLEMLWKPPASLFYGSYVYILASWMLVAAYKGHLSKANKWTICIFFIGIIGGYMYQMSPLILRERAELRYKNQLIMHLEEPASFLIFNSKQFIIGQDPYHATLDGVSTYNLKEWNALNPLALQKQLESKKMNYYFFKDIKENWEKHYQAYLWEHYRLAINYDTVSQDTMNTGLLFYKLKLDTSQLK